MVKDFILPLSKSSDTPVSVTSCVHEPLESPVLDRSFLCDVAGFAGASLLLPVLSLDHTVLHMLRRAQVRSDDFRPDCGRSIAVLAVFSVIAHVSDGGSLSG